MPSLADFRIDHRRAALDEDQVAGDPVQPFARWFEEARVVEVPEANAMTLVSVTAEGRPAARMVLRNGFDANGFVFHSNAASAKGRDRAMRPQAALLYFRSALERQVRIVGTVARGAHAEADAYFASRPRASRLGAGASPQSRAVADRAWLEARFAEFEAKHRGSGTIPRPPQWGGVRACPDGFEFGQGRPSRLHDRIAYRRDGEHRRIEWLAP